MKTVKYLLAGVVTVLLSVSITSCENYLDINDNPNYPAEAAANALLPSGMAGSVAALGFQYELFGGMWSQHYTQANTASQYIIITTYAVNSGDSYIGRMWSIPYSIALPDLDLVVKKSEADQSWNYWVIAKILMAFDYHILTDAFGDIPFTEALSGDGSPKFDDSKSVVYPGIIAMLDAAIAKQADAKGDNLPVIKAQDFVFDGNIDKWITFAKTLKLKLLMRDFEANKTAIQALLAEGDLLKEDAKVTCFEDAVNKSNPFYENDRRMLNTTSNVRACTTLCNYLLGNKDPRIDYFYEHTSASSTDPEVAEYVGLRFGDRPNAETTPLDVTSRAVIGVKDPVYFISAAETAFLKAECYARMSDKLNAKSNYDAAVTLSFDRWDCDASSFIAADGAYAFDDTSEGTMLNAILTQKWVASTRCQAWDAWFDINRTGIPALGDLTTDAAGYVLGTLTPSVSGSLPDNGYPCRMLYPSGSTDYNTNAPKVLPLTAAMWWHKK